MCKIFCRSDCIIMYDIEFQNKVRRGTSFLSLDTTTQMTLFILAAHLNRFDQSKTLHCIFLYLSTKVCLSNALVYSQTDSSFRNYAHLSYLLSIIKMENLKIRY